MRFYSTLCALFFCLMSPASAQAEVLLIGLPGKSYSIPIKVYFPNASASPAPVVIFSHGLGGSREGSVYLSEHWSNAGYLVVAIKHPGSDESIWKNLPRWKIAQAMKEAASLESFLNRINDVRTVLDYLEDSTDKQTHPLHGKLDTKHIALAGYSFGAVTTQAFMGQNFFRGGDQPYGDPRIDCFILMSPSQSKKLSNK